MEAGGYEVPPFDLLDLFVDDEELPLDCAGCLEADAEEAFLSFDGLFFCSCDAAVEDVFTAFLFLSPDASWAFLSSEFSGGAAASTAGWSASCTSGTTTADFCILISSGYFLQIIWLSYCMSMR